MITPVCFPDVERRKSQLAYQFPYLILISNSYLINKAFRGTGVNGALPSLIGGTLELRIQSL